MYRNHPTNFHHNQLSGVATITNLLLLTETSKIEKNNVHINHSNLKIIFNYYIYCKCVSPIFVNSESPPISLLGR